MPQTLSVRLLGVISIRHGERSLSGQLTGRQQEFIAYLALNRKVPQSRQRLSFQFWPDLPDDRARANLRKELSLIRKALPKADEFISVTGKTLQWNPESHFTLDVADFEEIAKKGKQATLEELERAISLYRGELLPDLDCEWVLPERDRLHQMFRQVLEKLINQLEIQRDYPVGVTYAQQLLRDDPLNEGAYCSLIRLYGLMGDRTSGLQTYHQCMTLLREELGIDPSATTQKLYEQLLRSEGETRPPLGSLPLSTTRFNTALSPLIGRGQEWKIIEGWTDSLLHQPAMISEVLLLAGEPGIGKTRLLEELGVMMQANHVQILWGSSFAAEMMRPYGFWIDALRSGNVGATEHLPDALSVLLPELGQPPQTLPDPSYLYDAVVNLLTQWAKPSPLLLLLDDIQWLDEASSALLNYVIRVMRHVPIAFACTARSGELTANIAMSKVLQMLRREQRLRTVEVQPLTSDQTVALIQSAGQIELSQISPESARQFFIDSGGNPFLALEIARYGGQTRIHPQGSLEVLIEDRLQQLDDATREFLPWAASLGRSFQPSTVAHVADYPITELLTVIEQLEQQSIIRPSTALEGEMGYDFAHDILRQVVYKQLSHPRRVLIHRQIAQKLSEQTTQEKALAGTIVHHADLGGDHVLATSAAIEATEYSLKLFAYTEALEIAQRGIQHCQFLEAKIQNLSYAKLLKLCAFAGGKGEQAKSLEQEAKSLIQKAKSLGSTEAETEALEALTILQFNQDKLGEVHQHSLRIAEMSQMVNPAQAVRLLAHSGDCFSSIGREIDRAEALLLEAQVLAERVGIENCDLESGMGNIHRHYGRYEPAKLHFQKAWKMAQTQQDHWRECYCLNGLAMIALEAGNPQDALPYCEAIVEVAAKIEAEGSEVANATALAALAHYQLNDARYETEIVEAIETLRQVDAKRMLAYILTEVAAVDLHHSRPEVAVQRAEVALANALPVKHPSAIALSGATLIQGLLASEEYQRATTEWDTLHTRIDYHSLSARAQEAIDRTRENLLVHQTSIAESQK